MPPPRISNRFGSVPVKHTVSPAFTAGTAPPPAWTVHFDVTARRPGATVSVAAGAVDAAAVPPVAGPEGACGAAVTPPFGLSMKNDVVADCAPAFAVAVAVAVPAQLGVIANWASRASAVATIELRPVHPPTVTVNSTFACRAKPVASNDTAESVRS